MLCQLCEDALLRPDLGKSSGFAYLQKGNRVKFKELHSSFSSLLTSLEAQCGLCHRLVNDLTSQKGSAILQEDRRLCDGFEPEAFKLDISQAAERSDNKVISLFYKVRAGHLTGSTTEKRGRLFLTLADDQGPLPESSEIAPDTSPTNSTISLVQNWIATCREYHSACRRETGLIGGPRFSRILDVGSEDEASVRLVLSEYLANDIKYVTLSHCWGDSASSIASLSTDNLNQYLSAIPLLTLPQTFQDAVHMTRRLGVRYLWIDSLCIIQNSREDWLDQAATMGQTYQASYLNLAATRSENAHGGLFTSRDQVAITPLRVAIDVCVQTAIGTGEGEGEGEGEGVFEEISHVTLTCTHNLQVWYSSADCEYCRDIDLNRFLGNNDGAFDEQGENFSHSASDVRLNGWALSASLKPVRGEPVVCEINLEPIVKRLDLSQQNVPVRKYKRFWYDVDALPFMKWSHAIIQSKLCKRGWVVQERLLAPRTLHFAAKQLFWECVEMQAYEEHPEPLNPKREVARLVEMGFKAWDPFSEHILQMPAEIELGLNYVWSSMKAMHRPEKTPFSKQDLRENASGDLLRQARSRCFQADCWMPTHALIKLWSPIVLAYRRSRLTHIEDRLIAIAGVARILRDRTGIRYVAGLWDYQLARQLLWSCSFQHGAREMDTYVAPSWSWASTAPLAFGFKLLLDPIFEVKGAMDLIDVLSVQLKGLGDEKDPLGALTGGKLLVRGRLLPIKIDLSTWPTGRFDERNLVKSWGGSTTRKPKGQIFLVPVLFTRWHERLPRVTFNSLLLEATETKGVFLRVGCAYLQNTYPLSRAVVGLEDAKAIYHEDCDDDADTEGEIDEGNDGEMAASPQNNIEPSLEQLVYTKVKDDFNDTGLLRGIQSLQKKLETARNRAGKPRQVTRLDSLANSIQQLQEHQPRKPGPRMPLVDTFHPEPGSSSPESQRAITVTISQRKKPSRPAALDPHPRISPRDAVSPEFYVDYVEDEKSRRFGNFVFEII